MGDNKYVLIALAIIAVYQQRGIVHAVACGISHGMTSDEVLSLVEIYEKLLLLVDMGQLP